MHLLRRHWLKHTAVVPKGFIRYHVLELLDEKPMSGSEIITEIEKRTEGHWKPSPGSIYPLLSWLNDNNYVRELPTDGNGMKPYTLTESGKVLLEEQRKIKMKLREEAKLLPPPFLGALWFRLPPEKTSGLRQSMRRLVIGFFELGSCLEERFSEKTVTEACELLSETAGKLEVIIKKAKGEKNE